jgi:hypothetical protein
VTSRLTGKEEVWVEVWVNEGWARRLGLDTVSTGVGDGPEKAKEFKISPDDLLGLCSLSA